MTDQRTQTFMILSEDVADGLSIRAQVRQDHLDWLQSPSDVSVLSAGPWLDETTSEMRGSLLIVSAPSRAALDQWMSADPYAKAGLPKQVDVRPFKLVIQNQP